MQKVKKRGLFDSKYFAKGNMDVSFLIIVLTLLTFGLVMLFSAGYSYAYYKYDDSTYFIRRQIIFAIIGIAFMLGISKLNFNYFRLLSVLAVGVSLILLVAVLVLPEYKPGFKRWINLGFTTFQPSEIAKIGIIMFFAWACEKWQDKIKSKDLKENFITTGLFAAVSGFFVILIVFEHHMSGAILMGLICIVMMYLGGFDKRYFIVGIILIAIVAVVVVMKPELLEEYAGERITAWLDKSFDPRGARWQVNQSLNAIGSGGFLGQGLGESKQKHLYVSEPQNDFIFAIVCEELGFVGATAIVVLFALLVWRGFKIAMNCRSKFGAMLAMGIVFQVGLQTILNIFVVTDTMPNTGISLPFFSYGGTSLVMLLAEMGIVLAISRFSDLSKK